MTFELCPCLDSVFAGVNDETALGTLADLGFRHFEFWDWRTHDLAAMARARGAYGLQPAVFSANTFAESLLSSAAHQASLGHVKGSIEHATRLGATALVIHVGYAVAGRPRPAQWDAAVEALGRAGDLAAESGIHLLIEPLNSTIDHPGYFLDSLPESLRLVRAVGHPSVRLLVDVYHLWVMHPDLLALLPDAVAVTGHVHLADAPGRHEPGTGAIPWPAVLALFAEHGYRGRLGLEYWPSTTPTEALARTTLILGAASELD